MIGLFHRARGGHRGPAGIARHAVFIADPAMVGPLRAVIENRVGLVLVDNRQDVRAAFSRREKPGVKPDFRQRTIARTQLFHHPFRDAGKFRLSRPAFAPVDTPVPHFPISVMDATQKQAGLHTVTMARIDEVPDQIALAAAPFCLLQSVGIKVALPQKKSVEMRRGKDGVPGAERLGGR